MLQHIISRAVDPIPQGDGRAVIANLGPQHHHILAGFFGAAVACVENQPLGDAYHQYAQHQNSGDNAFRPPDKAGEADPKQREEGVKQNHRDETQAHKRREAVARDEEFQIHGQNAEYGADPQSDQPPRAEEGEQGFHGYLRKLVGELTIKVSLRDAFPKCVCGKLLFTVFKRTSSLL